MTNAILLALIAYATFAWGDAAIKALGGQLSIFEIGFFITLFAGVFIFLMAKPAGERWRDAWRTDRPFAVQARAVSGITAGMLGVFAFTTIPLADVYALIFLSPFFVTVLSVVVLKEKVGPWRWLAVITGFAGVMMVVRPGFRDLELGHLAALVIAFLAGLTIILLRSLASTERRTTMMAVMIAYGLAFNLVGVAATMSLTLPTLPQAALLVFAGACTAVGQVGLLHATRLAPANLIAPTHYSQIVWAVVLGAAFFAEYPDFWALAGLVVVAASGLLTLVREQARLGAVRWNPFFRNRL